MGVRDAFYGVVPLPDGRFCACKVYGRNYSSTYDDPGGFEIDSEDPVEIGDINGLDPTEADYETTYTGADGDTVTLEEFCVEWLLIHGTFSPWEPSED